MRVNVRIFGEISKIYGSKHTIEIQDNSTISSIIGKIQENAGFTQSDYMGEWRVESSDLAIIVNGKNVNLMNGLKTTVHDNDDIVITPYVVGG